MRKEIVLESAEPPSALRDFILRIPIDWMCSCDIHFGRNNYSSYTGESKFLSFTKILQKGSNILAEFSFTNTRQQGRARPNTIGIDISARSSNKAGEPTLIVRFWYYPGYGARPNPHAKKIQFLKDRGFISNKRKKPREAIPSFSTQR